MLSTLIVFDGSGLVETTKVFLQPVTDGSIEWREYLLRIASAEADKGEVSMVDRAPEIDC